MRRHRSGQSTLFTIHSKDESGCMAVRHHESSRIDSHLNKRLAVLQTGSTERIFVLRVLDFNECTGLQPVPAPESLTGKGDRNVGVAGMMVALEVLEGEEQLRSAVLEKREFLVCWEARDNFLEAFDLAGNIRHQ